MKHNGMIKQFGVWWLIETDKDGKQWAVNGDDRRPYDQMSARDVIDSCLADGR